jgi:hypothetical protein
MAFWREKISLNLSKWKSPSSGTETVKYATNMTLNNLNV